MLSTAKVTQYQQQKNVSMKHWQNYRQGNILLLDWKSAPRATSFITNPTWTELGLNLGFHGFTPVNDCLTYAIAQVWIFIL